MCINHIVASTLGIFNISSTSVIIFIKLTNAIAMCDLWSSNRDIWLKKFLYHSYLFIDLCFNTKFSYLFFLSLFKAWKTKMTSPEKVSIRNKLKKVYMSPMSHTLFCHAAASFIRHTRRMCSNVCYWLVSYHFRWYIDKEIGVQ